MKMENTTGNKADEQYYKVLKKIIEKGVEKTDRTGTGTISLFSPKELRFNLKDGFPLFTHKKVHFKSIVHELLWFISGNTNIKYLEENKVSIWREWAYEEYAKKVQFISNTYYSEKEFVEALITNEDFASEFGSIGEGAYGKQWRDFEGTDQLTEIIQLLKNSPDSRRIIVSAWNPTKKHLALLPPCHLYFQFLTEPLSEKQQIKTGKKYKLNLFVLNRSWDFFLGCPFNVASYALLLQMVAQCVDMELGVLSYKGIDVHIYKNHLEQVNEVLNNRPIIYNLPTIQLNPDIKDIFQFKFEDISLINYNSYPSIKADVAV